MNAYRIATDEELAAAHCAESYDLLLGPNGFECVLTEPEDRRWSRDGKHVLAELNRLHEILSRVHTLLVFASESGTLDSIAGQSDITHPDEINRLCDDVARQFRPQPSKENHDPAA